MLWYTSDSHVRLLLVIYTPNILTLWNTQTGTKIWQLAYDYERQRDADLFLQIIQDPFNHQRAIGNNIFIVIVCFIIYLIDCCMYILLQVLGQNGLIFIEDLSPTTIPSGQSRRYFISNSNTNKSNGTPILNSSTKRSLSTHSHLTARLKTIIDGVDIVK
jgi:hypothetical protein